MRILNTTKNTLLADRVKVADAPLSRMVGLLSRKCIHAGEALVITQCRSIHMLFMRFPIDVVFVDKEYRVVGLIRSIKPFRLSPIFFKACSAIEGPVGMIDLSATEKGDFLRIEPRS